jgi:hypothetical protein
MSGADRLDALLAAALETGEIPPDATPSERIELQRLLEAEMYVRTGGANHAAEADASAPIARARFERFVAAARVPAPVGPAQGNVARRWWGVARAPRAALLSGAAAAVLIAIVAVAGVVVLSSGVESAAAQVLSPGAYVQVEGVVERADDASSLVITSELGRIRIALSGDTVIIDDRPGAPGPGPGARVLLSGIVGDGRVVVATTLAVRDGAPPPPGVGRFQRLEQFRPGVRGRIIAVALAEDATRAVVTIETPQGQRLIVPVAGPAAERVLRGGTAVGADVLVVEGEGGGPLGLELTGAADRPGGPPHGPIPAIRGIVTARAGDTLTVRTPDGPVDVVIQPRTRIMTAGTGLDPGAVARGEVDITGYGVVAAGGRRPGGPVIASHLAIGRDLR